LNKLGRTVDTAVNVGLGGKVRYEVRVELGKRAGNGGAVINIRL
jgi:hypothetical protein